MRHSDEIVNVEFLSGESFFYAVLPRFERRLDVGGGGGGGVVINYSCVEPKRDKFSHIHATT